MEDTTGHRAAYPGRKKPQPEETLHDNTSESRPRADVLQLAASLLLGALVECVQLLPEGLGDNVALRLERGSDALGRERLDADQDAVLNALKAANLSNVSAQRGRRKQG